MTTSFLLRTTTTLLASLIAVEAGASPVIAISSTGLAEARNKLSFVNSIEPPDLWICRARPQGGGTSGSNVMLAFMIPGAGDIAASMRVQFDLEGRSYAGSYRARGTAFARQDGEATIRLNSFTVLSEDTLPYDYEWSDPSNDVIELRVVTDTTGRGDKPYMMVGTQRSEFGVNDLACIAYDR